MTWEVRQLKSGDIHVVPLEDAQIHFLDRTCWCRPGEVEDHTDIVVHNAADGREIYEADWQPQKQRSVQ